MVDRRDVTRLSRHRHPQEGRSLSRRLPLPRRRKPLLDVIRFHHPGRTVLLSTARRIMSQEGVGYTQRIRATGRFWMAATVLTLVLAALMVRAMAANQAGGSGPPGSFTGQVVSASGALVVGGAASNPGHPVVGATLHLV